MKRAGLILFLAAVFAAAPAPANPAPEPAAAPAAAASTSLSDATLLAGIQRDLITHFNLQGSLELELPRGWVPPPRTAATWTVTVIEFPNLAGSAMMVRCRIAADGAIVAEPTVVVRAALWCDAWATRMPVTANTPFDPAGLEVRRVDVLRERDAVPATVVDPQYLFTCGLPAGRLLTWHDVARRPLVRRGQSVEVTAAEGTLVVTMKAVAMENGARGQTVTVRNPESQRDFSALVVDENHVRVQF